MAIALTAAVLGPSIDHFLFVGILRAGLIGAIMNAIAEVLVTAQTDHICSAAAQFFCLSQQIIDAILLHHVRSVTRQIAQRVDIHHIVGGLRAGCCSERK